MAISLVDGTVRYYVLEIILGLLILGIIAIEPFGAGLFVAIFYCIVGAYDDYATDLRRRASYRL